MSTKNARWAKKSSTGPVIMLAANSSKAHEIFGGKTLEQIGQELDLSDEDVTFGYSDITGGRTIKSLLIHHGGVKWQIPFSLNSKSGELASLDSCMDWMFRTGFKSVVKDGIKQVDEKTGKPILANGENGTVAELYMSFGKPNGLTVDREEAAFAEPVTIENTVV